MGPLFTTDTVPEYHDGMLLVQMQAVTFTGPANLGIAAEAVAVPQTGGIAMMSYLEKAGLVKRVTPVARSGPASEGAQPRSFSSIGLGATATMVINAAPPEAKQRPDSGLNLIELERDADVLHLQKALASDPNVASVSRVPTRYLALPATSRQPARSDSKPTLVPSGVGIAAVPPEPSTMWNLKKIRWAEARQTGGFADAVNVNVAVLDTGIDANHPDLDGRVSTYAWNHPDLPTASAAQDVIGHGTHVAGTIAASINNGLGINGICQCRIHAWKIFDDIPDFIQTPFGARFVYFVEPVMYLRALLECIDGNIDIINLSIGGPGRPSTPEAQAFQRLIDGGVIVVAAMGNERRSGSPTSYPAAIPGVVAVGATGLTDEVTSFSNRGNHITVSAPGDAIWSTLPTYPGQLGWEAVIGPDGQPRQGKPDRRETNYDAWPGTSMATPHVAGAMALYLANGGKKGGQAARQALADSAVKVPAMNGSAFSPDYGFGRLDLLTLVQRAQQDAQNAKVATS